MSLFFVSPLVGSDANPGTSDAPFRSVAHGISVLQPGDTLQLIPDSIYPPAVFPATLRGTAEAPITIASAGPGPAVFDAGLPELTVANNDEWEPVPEGHPEEWRTKRIYQVPSTVDIFRFGQIQSSGHRLLTYSIIDDLRATNESYESVPLSDPRPAGGPLVDDPTRKRPWVYMGPGIFWVFDGPDSLNGRIHVRLSHTHFDAQGIRDYDGETDPNRLGLSIARDNLLVARIASRHMRFTNITFQNGGEATIQVIGQHLTFDHCQVYGSRFGVRIGGTDHLTFTHCTFDGGLSPYTVRSDVKSEYTYYSPYLGPGHPDNRTRTNHLANKTSDMLVLNHADVSEFAYCTFRRGHDAIRVRARDVDIHHCLFEDLNDEAVQFHEDTDNPNILVHENLFRQVLHPISFALNQPGGPHLIYRNVIDQRVPTRGFRKLPPDVPAPFIWRYGASFKMGNPVPAFCFYHNTVLSSHPGDKASALTLAFANAPPAPAPARVYLNNLHVGLNLSLPYSWVVPNDPTRTSDGNLWSEPDRTRGPLFQLLDGTDIETMEELAQIDPDWERDGTFADPHFVNFTDEHFDHQVVYPNHDLRLAPGSPGVGSGVVLPPDLPDPLRPPDGSTPDVGALSAAPLAVGVDASTVLPEPNVPIAVAGADQEVIDADGDGFASVTVDGSSSSDPNGLPLRYRWTLGGRTLAAAATASLMLPEGEHYLRLQVSNGNGLVDTDAVRVVVRPAVHHGENLLRSPGFEEDEGWHIQQASYAQPANTHSGVRAIEMDAVSQDGVVRQVVPVSPNVVYTISAWIKRITSGPTTIRAVFRDIAGDSRSELDMTHDTPLGTYVYREATVTAPDGAATLEVRLGHELTGGVLFDDVRVLDRNLLVNPGFETPAPSGREDAAPGWRFERGGAVIDEPAQVRGQAHALAITGAAQFRQVRQIVPIIGERPYRVSGWVKRGPTVPQLAFRFTGSSEIDIALDTIPEGVYTFVSRTENAPPAATELAVRLGLAPGAIGTSYFDDLIVEEVLS